MSQGEIYMSILPLVFPSKRQMKLLLEDIRSLDALNYKIVCKQYQDFQEHEPFEYSYVRALYRLRR